VIARVLLTALLLGVPLPAAAQDTVALHTLTVIWPRAGLPSGHRITIAYPNLLYRIPLVADGGCLPYTWQVTGGPAWLTVTTYAGPDGQTFPQLSGTPTNTTTDDDASITVTVTDNCSGSDNDSFGIDVTTTPFEFIDPTNGTAAASNGCSSNCGTGTQAAPWLTLNDWAENRTVGRVTYIRAGTLNFTGVTLTGPCTNNTQPETKLDIDDVMLIAYPGDTRPVIDGGWTAGVTWTTCPSPPFIVSSGDRTWIEGVEFEGFLTKALRADDGGALVAPVFWRNVAHDIGPSVSGANGAFVMIASPGLKYGGFFGQNDCSALYGVGDAVFADCIKSYDIDHFVVEGNYIHAPASNQYGNDGAVSIKGRHGRVEVRLNTCTGWRGTCVGGNSGWFDGYELRYNLLMTSGDGTSTGEPSEAFSVARSSDFTLNFNARRNTMVGRVRVFDGATDDITFTNNVIINEDVNQTYIDFFCDGDVGVSGWADCNGLSPGVDIIDTDNLKCQAATGCIDGSGLLTGSSRTTYLGVRGHEMAGAAEADTAPRRFRFRTADSFSSPCVGPEIRCLQSEPVEPDRSHWWLDTPVEMDR
jgi:hypothetical protein